MSLDLGLLISGAKERGELESRVTNILSECKDAGNIILMCDHACMLRCEDLQDRLYLDTCRASTSI